MTYSRVLKWLLFHSFFINIILIFIFQCFTFCFCLFFINFYRFFYYIIVRLSFKLFLMLQLLFVLLDCFLKIYFLVIIIILLNLFALIHILQDHPQFFFDLESKIIFFRISRWINLLGLRFFFIISINSQYVLLNVW